MSFDALFTVNKNPTAEDHRYKREREEGDSQNTQVLEPGEVALGDTRQVIPIQLPGKKKRKDTQTHMND